MAIDGRERTFRRRTRRRKRSGRIGPLEQIRTESYPGCVTCRFAYGITARPVTSLPAPRCSSSAAATAKPFFTVLRLVTGRRGRGEEASLQSGYNIEGSSLQAYPARPSGEAQKHMHKRGEMGLRQAPSD
ncbi:uncharacterized protein CIMG_10605 [Coccidioides immitis RS]|uniref:Uncharacterized protein n=1 Tax=Coccidioides immitis (strain RS) TaxID=246410 RepID=A0A0D8JSL5_COCIM|nr:uncharacterized protein CIMG_10605 [Coccidioides immitis RS]KJF60277.1 hypothetical protein CIMG_10605 [Coccidioides immitis RS]